MERHRRAAAAHQRFARNAEAAAVQLLEIGDVAMAFYEERLAGIEHDAARLEQDRARLADALAQKR